MLKKILLAAVGIALVVGAIVFAKLGQFTAMGESAANMILPPETVTATMVEETKWEQTVSAAASASAVQGVMVSAEVGGRVTSIGFESGTVAKAGDVLVQLDTTSEGAQLASAKAAAALAKSNLARVRKLNKQAMSSQEAIDNADAKVKESAAQVRNIRSLIAKKTIRAPFSGQLGLRLINLGQILSAGDAIVSLQTHDPIFVDFSLPQQELRRIEPGLVVRVSSDAAPGKTFSGKILATNPDVDPATRSVRVRAQIANPDDALRAGMFVNAEVVFPQKQTVLPVAATAISYAPFGDSVFVVDTSKDEASGKTEQVLRQQFVRLGRARGDFVDVTAGLKSGETVVTSGVFKLRGGMKVVIDNTLAPTPSLAPHPADS
ncbi:MAG: efflux RND transporter periplasmic adaptor subunit [bacterium]